jgi:aspartate/methionine/tyrosine aminotransferase
MLPLAKIREAAAAKLAEDNVSYLQYGYISGYPVFRKSLAAFLSKHYGRGACDQARDGRCTP